MARSDPSPGTGFTYRAFISYSHRDKAWGDWLHKALEGYRVPSRLVGTKTEAGTVPRRLNPVFRDREELASATDLGRKVNEALAQSESMIVICSPAAAASRWVNEEVLAYKRMGRGERIFCLIVAGEPGAADMPGREAEECFCSALRYRLDANGQPTHERTEPIAADAREGKDGKSAAKLKLIAGLLGVGYDALRQREQHRKVQRMVAVTSVAVAVMAMTVVLAVFALISRHDAVAAQHQAVAAQHAAERRQKQAEGLINFMLGDLNDKLQQVGRLDIMQSVDDKAMAYFESLPTADVTDEALAQRTKALEKIGSVRMDRGLRPAALKAYQAAAALAAKLTRRQPANFTYLAAYADSLKWVGQAYWFQGDLEHALQNFTAASASLEIVHAAQPDDSDVAFKLAMAQVDSGRVLEARGKFAAAETKYQAELQIFEKLLARMPGNTRWQSRLGYAWDDLGQVALERGELGDALTDYGKDQHIKAALAARNPDDRKAQGDLLVSEAILGDMFNLCGDAETALHYTRAAVVSAKALTAFDHTNVGWREYFGIYNQDLGVELRELGQLKRAAVVDADAVHTLGALAAKDPTSSDYRWELAESQLESARLRLAEHDPDAAQTMAKPAVETILQMHTRKPDNRALSRLTAQAYILSGQIAEMRNDEATAHDDWVHARDITAPMARASNDPSLLASWASALLLLNQNDAAKSAVEKLAAMGYRKPDFIALMARRHVAYPADTGLSKRMAGVMK